MTAVEHYHVVAAFRDLDAVANVRSSTVYGSFRVDGRQNVHRRYIACIVIVLVARRLGQLAAAYLIVFAKRVIRIVDLIHHRIDLLVQGAAKHGEANLNGLFDVIQN